MAQPFVKGVSVKVPVRMLKCGDRHMEAEMYSALKSPKTTPGYITAEVEQEKQAYNQHTLHEEHLRTDSEYAALIARDRLGLAAPGETIYSFPRSDRDGGSTRGER